jgi:hypothetical protein
LFLFLRRVWRHQHQKSIFEKAIASFSCDVFGNTSIKKEAIALSRLFQAFHKREFSLSPILKEKSIGRAQSIHDDHDIDHLLQYGAIYRWDEAEKSEDHANKRKPDADDDTLPRDLIRTASDMDRITDFPGITPEYRDIRRLDRRAVLPLG